MAYATIGELTARLPDGLTAPTGAEASRLLDEASAHIDTLLISATYDVDTDGDPTDAAIITALRDATCAQAAWWIETGDEQGAAAAMHSAGSGGGPYWGGSIPRSAPKALDVLRRAVSSTGVALLAYGPWV